MPFSYGSEHVPTCEKCFGMLKRIEFYIGDFCIKSDGANSLEIYEEMSKHGAAVWLTDLALKRMLSAGTLAYRQRYITSDITNTNVE